MPWLISRRWAIRGGFVATFMNKYAALPMALTGTLSNATAGRRIKETATFLGLVRCPAHSNASALASRRRPWCA